MVEAAFAALVVALAVIEAVAGLGAPFRGAAVALTALVAAAAGWRVWRAAAGTRRRPRWRDLWPPALILAWPAAMWLRLVALAWRRPVYDWDGLYYHLPALQGWVQAGRVAWLENVPDIPYANGYPGGVEVLSLVIHQLTGSSAFVDGTNLLLWPVGALGLVVIARRLGTTGLWRWLPAALAAGVPIVVVHSTTCYTDVGFAAAVIAALAAMILFAFAPDLPLRLRAPLLGAALGLMLATKGTGAPFMAIIGGAALVAAIVTTARRRWRLLPAVAVVVIVATLAGGSWYVRNQRHTGNPLFPIAVQVGPWTLAEGWRPVDLVDPNLPAWLTDLPRPLRPLRCWVEPSTPVREADAATGLGWLWVGAGLPAALWAAVWAAARRRGGAATLLVGVGLLLIVVHPAAWWSRQTVWLHAIGLPCLALAFARAPRRLAIAGALACAVVAVWEGESALAGERARGGEVTTTWDYYFPSIPGAPGFDRALAAPVIARSDWSRVGALVGGALCLPLEARRIVHVPASADSAAVAGLRAAGVTWVIWDRLAAGEPPAALLDAADERHRHTPAEDLDLEALRLEAR